MNQFKIKAVILDVRSLANDEFFNLSLARMSKLRQEKVLKYHFRKDMNLSLGAGMVLDKLLEKYNLNESSMKYSECSKGKPWFADRTDLHFNLSHAGTYAMGVISKSEVGVDIEQTIFADDALLERCCHPTEIKYLNSLSQEKCNKEFTRIWTIKESFIKAIGAGLNYESLTDLYTHPTEPLLNGHNMPGKYSYYQAYLNDYSFAICTQGELEAKDIDICIINTQ